MALFRRRSTSRAESTYSARSTNGVTFHTSRTRIGDLAIVVRRFPRVGPSEAGDPTYVCVHGIGVSSRYFLPLAAALARRGTVYAVDLPGYGLAPDPVQDVSIVDHATVLARFLQENNIRNPVLIGHSMGAQVVSQLLFDFPAISDRMVLLDATVEPRRRSLLILAGRLSIDVLREPILSNWSVLTDYFLRCGIPYYLRQLPHLIGDRIEHRLPAITAKTLVIRGTRDPVSSREWALKLTALLPDARFAEVPGPHVIMFTAPEDIADLICLHFDDTRDPGLAAATDLPGHTE